ncbi:type II secretion system minor pseudopilin GspH [Legionella impletisoli]|uniref:Type II secretion system protein H n=1 Tax=Legionella impletisoli TaxID=343510 RepID=A0A917N8L9_9GAMM|nr:type II secretion system minor pseudopilin GspH [Legionella impletisoli]GGI76710.1 type II secretory pathway protein LspH [Legionella impletisoli]
MRNKPVSINKTKAGFTLLEILIVMVIIGIALTFALLSFGDFGGKRKVIVAAEQFANYIKLAQQQAILEASTLGIDLSSKGYQVVRYSPQGIWQKVSDKGIFSFQKIPTSARLQWDTNRPQKDGPEIIINASGDMSPFVVSFNLDNETKLVTIRGNHDGHINIDLAK